VTHKFSRYMILAISALGLSALPALADSACPADALLSTYLTAGYSCYIGDLDFANFSYTNGSSNPPAPTPATSVSVFADNSASGIGFTFDSSWTASGANNFSDGDIGFTVSIVGGGSATLDDAALIETGGIIGTGSSASVGEFGCSNPAPPASCSQQWALLTAYTSNDTIGEAGVIYSPTGEISVSKDIVAQDGSGANSYATVSTVQDLFSTIPEPSSLPLLLGFGLAAGIALKKKLSAKS
jgi:hypothetical protein